ncbi:hypothetical protein N0V90_011412 [Kalmusia sp. IMI 367209]|nr:hypothetical protein N0V90_011412 [Kalmusia sp. IMI 367209]
MLDHFSFFVPASRYEEIIDWYLAVLAPLNYTKQFDIPGRAVGLGPSPTEAVFWIGAREENTASGFHLAFKAKDHATVDKFHEEALKLGGKDNGKPGPRPMYGPNYYGAFVFDPLGNNIEVVDKAAH